MPIHRGQAGAGVDDQQRDIGEVERALGLRPHAAGQRIRRRFLEPGRVDQAEFEIGDAPLALAAVAGDARQIVDERQLPADKPVEQSRLADIGPPDDRDGKRHRPA